MMSSLKLNLTLVSAPVNLIVRKKKRMKLAKKSRSNMNMKNNMFMITVIEDQSIHLNHLLEVGHS